MTDVLEKASKKYAETVRLACEFKTDNSDKKLCELLEAIEELYLSFCCNVIAGNKETIDIPAFVQGIRNN